MSEVKSNRAWREECESLRQQLAAALAAIKVKDEQLRLTSENLRKGMPKWIQKQQADANEEALAIQPDDSALKDKL